MREVLPILSLLRIFNHDWMLGFIKLLFCTYRDNYISFLSSLLEMNYVSLFSNVMLPLRTWDRLHLVMFCWIQSAKILVRISESMFMRNLNLQSSFLIKSFSGFD